MRPTDNIRVYPAGGLIDICFVEVICAVGWGALVVVCAASSLVGWLICCFVGLVCVGRLVRQRG
jgi:hypothetical protein